MQISKLRLGFLLAAVSAISIIAVFLLPPIPQDDSFHDFADKRTIFSIEHFWNVVSNLLFLFIGIVAMLRLWKNKLVLMEALKPAYYLFFIGVLLIGFGSAWYHHHPDNRTLAWDRLPMTIAFMSLLNIALAEFVNLKAAKASLIPFILIGVCSIAWWQYGEYHQHGDLRLYVLVQFLPILLITTMFLFGRCIYITWGYLALFFCYLLAKITEHFDFVIFKLSGGLIAGHLVKHIITAIGLWLFLVYLQKRRPSAN